MQRLSLFRFSLAVAVPVLAFATALWVNTLRQPSRQLAVAPLQPAALPEAEVAQRLAGALRFRTISRDTRDADSAAEFDGLHGYLAQQFPRTHATLRREVIGGHSLLYTWQGRDTRARPMMLMAHQDVVPVAEGGRQAWRFDPFAGQVAEGYVWGRGAWDDKSSLMAQLEAVERLIGEGYAPRRTIYFAFGHDEELGGADGARRIAMELAARGVQLEFVVDEGMPITQGVLGGVSAPVALVGVAEKGIANLTLTARAEPGHSSAPPRHGVIARLGRALARLEDDPMPVSMEGVTRQMFDTLAPEMTGLRRVALSNRWLTGPLVRRQLANAPATDAMLRTSLAPTLFQAGVKSNVLPGVASATVNARLLPGDTPELVARRVRERIADDGIEVKVVPPATAASPVSRTRAPGYAWVSLALRETLPGVVVAPALVIGGTDARHMQGIADDVYRITPVVAQPSDLARFHGTNERIAVRDYVRMIRFYQRLMLRADAR